MALISDIRSQYLNGLTQPTALAPGGSECGICKENMPVNEPNAANRAVYAHDEQHVHCLACLTRWAQENKSCPFCRVSLYGQAQPSEGEDVEIGDDGETDWEMMDEIGVLLSSYQSPGNEGATAHNLHPLVLGIQERVHFFLAERLPMDVEYNATPNRAWSTSFPVAAENGPQQLLDARTVIMGLWQSWRPNFLNNIDAPDVFHHPLANALLLEMIAALNDWDGTTKDPLTLRVCLRCRIGGFEMSLAAWMPQSLENDWEGYKEWMINTVVNVFAALPERAEELREAAEGHEALFKGGMVKSVMPRGVSRVSS